MRYDIIETQPLSAILPLRVSRPFMKTTVLAKIKKRKKNKRNGAEKEQSQTGKFKRKRKGKENGKLVEGRRKVSVGVEEQLASRDVPAAATRALGCTLRSAGVILFMRRVSPIISRPRTTVARDLCQRHRTGSVCSFGAGLGGIKSSRAPKSRAATPPRFRPAIDRFSFHA